MPDIAIHLTPAEHRRLQQAAEVRGLTAEQLVAEEIRRRYALMGSRAHVVPMHKPPTQGGKR